MESKHTKESESSEENDGHKPEEKDLGFSARMGFLAGFFHALYWVVTLYIHRKEVLYPDEPSPIEYLPFNRLMYIRLMHYGLQGFCGIIMSFVSFLSRQADLA